MISFSLINSVLCLFSFKDIPSVFSFCCILLSVYNHFTNLSTFDSSWRSMLDVILGSNHSEISDLAHCFWRKLERVSLPLLIKAAHLKFEVMYRIYCNIYSMPSA